jgi:hypothetical protein
MRRAVDSREDVTRVKIGTRVPSGRTSIDADRLTRTGRGRTSVSASANPNPPSPPPRELHTVMAVVVVSKRGPKT